MPELRRPEPLDPYILLAQEDFRDVVREICDTSGSGALAVKTLVSKTGAEIEDLLDDIGFGEFLDLPEDTPIPEGASPLTPEITARYRERPMTIDNLVDGEGAVTIPGQKLWNGEINFIIPYSGSYSGGSVYLIDHAITLTSFASDNPPYGSSTLRYRLQHDRELTTSTMQVGEPRPFEFDSIAAFCALAVSLHAENASR